MADAYVRIDPTGVRIFGDRVHDHSLVFVDLHEGDLSLLRHADPSLIQRAQFVLVRASDGEKRVRRELARIVAGLSPRAQSGTLKCDLGEAATIVPRPVDVEDLVRRARAVEMRALLEWGRAVWQPAQYHFRLPSGEHASSFIRLSSAIRSPHDATALATWLCANVEEDVGVVVDTGTLTPIVTALQGLVVAGAASPVRLGRIVVLQEYPHTQLAVNSAVGRVADSGAVLALLSVNSSGELRDRMLNALETNQRTGLVRKWSLHVLVDRQDVLPQISSPTLHTWLSLGGVVAGTGDPPRRPQDCLLCKDEERAAVVQIDPSSYEGTVAARTRLIMPSTDDSKANRRFWELCDTGNAALVHADADVAAKAYRAPGRLGIKIDFDRLLEVPEFPNEVAMRLGEVFREHEDRDLVLVPEHDHRRPQFAEFWRHIQPVLGGSAQVAPFPIDQPWSDELLEASRQAKHLCLLSLGAVTGASLQAAYLAVQEARKKVSSAYDIHGVVVHARPSDDRRLKNLRNVFEHSKFHCVWECRIPEVSPIQAELEILNRLAPDLLTRRAKDFHELRRRLCVGQLTFNDNAVLWGADTADRLTPHSMFGEQMRAPATFLAVGAAIHRRRLYAIDRFPAPDRVAFELPAIAYSYFDPIIFSCMLRWLRPGELWWGEQDDGAGGVVRGLDQRAKDANQRCILIAELLLALAQGKLRQDAKSTLLEVARRTLTSASDDRAGALELGIALAEQLS